MKKRTIPTYQLTDHICRREGCQGRILVQVSPHVITGGGNPLYRCSGCGKGCAAMDTSPLCWCGMGFKGQEPAGFHCMRIDEAKDKPWIAEAMGHCGFDIRQASGEIGVVQRDGLKIAEQRYWESQKDAIP
jgi:hypothetical protein